MKLIMENWREYVKYIDQQDALKEAMAEYIPGTSAHKMKKAVGGLGPEDDIDPHAKTIDVPGRNNPRLKLNPTDRLKRHGKLEALQRRITMRNGQQQWLDDYNVTKDEDGQGMPFPNVLDKDGEEYHTTTINWSIEDIQKLINFFNQGLGSAGIVKQAAHQRQKSGVTAAKGHLEENN